MRLFFRFASFLASIRTYGGTTGKVTSKTRVEAHWFVNETIVQMSMHTKLFTAFHRVRTRASLFNEDRLYRHWKNYLQVFGGNKYFFRGGVGGTPFRFEPETVLADFPLPSYSCERAAKFSMLRPWRIFCNGFLRGRDHRSGIQCCTEMAHGFDSRNWWSEESASVRLITKL